MASDQREASSSADPKGTERDFSTGILERKMVANRLVVDEAVNVVNFVVSLNLMTMKKLQFFRGDTIQLKGNPYWSMMHTNSYKYGYYGSGSNPYWSMYMELGLQIPVLNPAQTTSQRNVSRRRLSLTTVLTSHTSRIRLSSSRPASLRLCRGLAHIRVVDTANVYVSPDSCHVATSVYVPLVYREAGRDKTVLILGSEITNGGIKGSLTGISIDTVIGTQKVWRSLQAFGDIAFA